MTADEQAGIDWWNGLTERDRAFWLQAATSAVPAEAWRFFKSSISGQSPPRGTPSGDTAGVAR